MPGFFSWRDKMKWFGKLVIEVLIFGVIVGLAIYFITTRLVG